MRSPLLVKQQQQRTLKKKITIGTKLLTTKESKEDKKHIFFLYHIFREQRKYQFPATPSTKSAFRRSTPGSGPVRTPNAPNICAGTLAALYARIEHSGEQTAEGQRRPPVSSSIQSSFSKRVLTLSSRCPGTTKHAFAAASKKNNNKGLF